MSKHKEQNDKANEEDELNDIKGQGIKSLVS